MSLSHSFAALAGEYPEAVANMLMPILGPAITDPEARARMRAEAEKEIEKAQLLLSLLDAVEEIEEGKRQSRET